MKTDRISILKSRQPEDLGQTVSHIWTFIFFVMIFRDLHEMSTASTIAEILEGRFEGNPVTDAGLVIGGLMLVILLLTSLLSNFLRPEAVRKLNLAVTPIALLGSLYLPPNDPDDFLLIGVASVALVTIFILCLKWRPRPRSER